MNEQVNSVPAAMSSFAKIPTWYSSNSEYFQLLVAQGQYPESTLTIARLT